ncbi:ABC transporter ATP-binding protein [Microbacterium jejuense]|uniref:ABC transporter ATP-binding protein n=1 Tax=Microbacterium jejuense TaxID=1263637 RepID=A0ABS7HSM9_9MICO|nr:ABC transporter ATP-binding protein [Microbacterium jejuense]MBW9095668.1 ABC transporter ATP-binding protein [Microbacterium jejuense]
MADTALPIAGGDRIRSVARTLVRLHRGELLLVITLHAAAAMAGLVGPWLVGRLIDGLSAGTADVATVDTLILLLAGAVAVQAVVTRFAQLWSLRLGESVFAKLREDFISTVTSLPLAVVERAGTGDLLSRTTSDVDAVAQTVRFGVPRILVTGMTVILTLAAAFIINPLVAVAMLVGVPLIALSSRWYLKRSGPGYRRQLASYGRLVGVINETVEGARTIDALDLAPLQRVKIDRALAARNSAERYTLGLRSVWYPLTTLGFLLPVIAVLLWGAYLAGAGLATVGAVTAIALYAMQLTGPVEELVNWMDRLQVGTTALARIVGVEEVPTDRPDADERPADEQLEARGIRFSYREGVDVLRDVDLVPRVGERIAIVGPSGSGKSTLARLLTGITAPSAGQVRVGGADVMRIPLDVLRRHVALVSQEHHVFVGTLADNLRLAAPDARAGDLEEALQVVGALRWMRAMPQGLDTTVGSGGVVLTPAQAQQIALARLVLLDPHTLVLDEATSLLDPRAARGLEQSLDRVLEGRTVIAIAHRLHTARDADRIIVMRDGRIVESGAHDELVAHDGEYAALWRSWQAESAADAGGA